MSIQIRDEGTAAALATSASPQDILGPAGQLLGRFIPTSNLKVSFPELEITDEELDQLRNDPDAKWCTPDDVTARLREIDRCTP
jgi:hypothetical protein